MSETSDHSPCGVPLDTSSAAHARQRDAYIRMGGKERVAIMFRLNETVRAITAAGIRARHPEYTDEQVRLAYRRLVLGDELVQAVWPDCALVVP